VPFDVVGERGSREVATIRFLAQRHQDHVVEIAGETAAEVYRIGSAPIAQFFGADRFLAAIAAATALDAGDDAARPGRSRVEHRLDHFVAVFAAGQERVVAGEQLEQHDA